MNALSAIVPLSELLDIALSIAAAREALRPTTILHDTPSSARGPVKPNRLYLRRIDGPNADSLTESIAAE